VMLFHELLASSSTSLLARHLKLQILPNDGGHKLR